MSYGYDVISADDSFLAPYDDECYEPETDEPQSAFEYLPGTKFVNVYEIDRGYGGPEEGGWYYDCGTVILSRQVPETEAERVASELEKHYPNTRTVGNILYNGGDYRVLIEDFPGRDYPETIPHYE